MKTFKIRIANKTKEWELETAWNTFSPVFALRVFDFPNNFSNISNNNWTNFCELSMKLKREEAKFQALLYSDCILMKKGWNEFLIARVANNRGWKRTTSNLGSERSYIKALLLFPYFNDAIKLIYMQIKHKNLAVQLKFFSVF